MSSFEGYLDSSEGILVSFYLGESCDDIGRTIQEIHSWDYDQLEDVHDYIQWLFPLTERSNFNSSAPLLDKPQIERFRSDDRLIEQLLISFEIMLNFYGFNYENIDGSIQISRSHQYAERKNNFLKYSHNFLRITRILKSLRLLGLETYAQSFFDALTQLYLEEGDKISSLTFTYWQQAVNSPIE